MAGFGVVLLAWVGTRHAAVTQDFAAHLAAARGGGSTAAGIAVLPTGRAVTVLADGPDKRPVVIPARAGTPTLGRMAPRPRGDDDGVRPTPGARPMAPVDLARIDAPPRPAPPRATTAGDLASRAYAVLARGDRRRGAALLDAAIALGGDPRAAGWTRDRDALRRRWSASAYVVARGPGDAGLAARPVLGGGQGGVAVAYALDPLARRPLSLIARATVPNAGAGLDRARAQAAVGLGWRLAPGVTLAAERLIPLGDATRGAWTLRAAAGASGRRAGVEATVYAEAGVAGAATYAAAQARADAPVRLATGVRLHIGAGAWGGIQHDGASIGRLDIGPALRLAADRLPMTVSIDYRVRVAGSAAPGNGVVVTLSTAF